MDRIFIYFGFFVFITISKTNGALNFSCFDFKPDPKVVNFPSLPPSYKVLIEVANTTGNVTEDEHVADIVEHFDGAQKIFALHRADNDGKRYQWIFYPEQKNYTFVEDDFVCKSNVTPEKFPDGLSPLLFPEIISTPNDPVINLKTLWDHFTKSQSTGLDPNVTEHDARDHGIPVDHYIGCSNVTGSKHFVEYDVCLSAKNFTMPGGKTVGQVPTRIEVKVYEGKTVEDAKMLANVVYEFSGYRTDLTEAQQIGKFLPPVGVFCDGMNSTKEFPLKAETLPKFQVQIEYSNQHKSSIDSNMLLYDSIGHVASFDFTSNYTDEPIAASADLTDGHYRIVHDFTSGLEYVVDQSKGVCQRVAEISSNSADVDKTSKIFDMKNMVDVLLTHEAVNFLYVGTRYLDSIPCDVWIARCNDTNPNQHKIYEVYILSSNWSIENGIGGEKEQTPLKSLPIALRVYHGENASRTITTQHFHGYKKYDKDTPIAWEKVDVLPCLSFVQNYSYLVVTMKFEGEKDAETMFKTLGYETVKNKLRVILAEKSNVSALRITEFYFQPVQKDLWVFFLLANKSDVAGATTKWSSEEIDVSKAYEKLNASLMAGEIKFDINKIKFTVLKGSLNLVPPFFHPSNATAPVPTNNSPAPGYTSGSMAGLGICMLLIGGVAGLGLAFFLWKRNRGIAYQIYE